MIIYYVYIHYDKDLPVYVGMGKGGRCWDTNSTRRNAEHKEWMLTQLPFLNYKICFASSDRRSVLKVENKLIRDLNPKFNMSLNKKLSKTGKKVLSDNAKDLNKLKKTCGNCGKSFSLGMYARWHGNNCKQG